MSYWGFRPYVSAAQKRANAAREAAKMAKAGRKLSPVTVEGRKIATTFWGTAWCDNLESYSDFANRLPRGRTYVRNGSVLDLQISEGKMTALVSGSELYKIEIKIKPLSQALWRSVQTECAGKIDSLIELLQGRLSASVMEIVTRRENGLFPKPAEISMKCSCPDWAGMCKHLAACLYGVGARLDEKPDLLFLLRAVDASALISKASAEALQPAPSTGTGIKESDLAEVFGIDLDPTTGVPQDNGHLQTRAKKPRRSLSAQSPEPKRAVPAARAKPDKKALERKPATTKVKRKLSSRNSS